MPLKPNIRNLGGFDPLRGRANSWRDHPLVIATTTCVATIGMCFLVFDQLVMPLELATLNAKVAQLDATISKSESLSKELDTTQSELAATKLLLKEAQSANLFMPGNPYPIGLGKVRIGDSISKVRQLFPAESIDNSQDDYLTVKLKDNIFGQVVYYFDKESSKKTISHLLFFLDFQSSYPDSFLHDKLIDSFGSPKEWSRKGYYSWAVDKEDVFQDDKKSFVIMRRGGRLAIWPDK